MSKIYVLYHSNCQDGLGAKFAAWKKFGDKAEYIPVQYGQPLPEINGKTTLSQVSLGERYQLGGLSLVKTADSETTPFETGFVTIPRSPDTEVYVAVDVFIVDFSYPRDVLEALRARVNTLVILDHHRTAEEALRGFPGAHFDMNKSGAVLAWEYFHPDVPVPELLLNVQDRDLWQFKLKQTPAITAALPLLRGDMDKWDALAEVPPIYWDLAVDGDTILEYNEIQVENALKEVVVLPFKGYKAGVRNYTSNPSDLGNAICKSEELAVDFSLTYFINIDGRPVFSFRSQGDMDVSILAKELSGGGHKNAAGATVTMDILADLLAGKL